VKPSTSTSTPVHAENRQTEKNDSSPQKNYKKKMTPKQKAEVQADDAFTAYFKAKMSRLDAIPTQRSSEDERKEALKMFLLSLMPELLQFSESQLKLFKRRVFGLIDDITIMETNSIAPPPMTTSSLSAMSSSSTLPSLVQQSINTGHFYENFRHSLNPNEFTTCDLVIRTVSYF
jgi:hypothetical protein